ncbi:MAG: aminotransferase class I/II-fold pyridoxal phosphate-dependent enzyme [Candidatus Electrothrix sp. AUS4]|nr:aminotransferase class I/II-fold pyridoxal phosphate-dependent enzyme [Candidatus Electrothrix sp. AUS4]
MDLNYLFAPEAPPAESIKFAGSVVSDGRMFRYDFDSAEQSPVAMLEDKFSERIGKKYALAVNSCGSALQIALLAAGVIPGEPILVPAFTFTAVISAIINCGCTPVLVDIEDNYCISLSDLKKKHKKNIRFLLLSYMRGRVSRLDEIINFCQSRGIEIIEDCAHSLGSSWDNRPTGDFGVVSCFSFHDKLLSAGEGGMLLTDSPKVIMKATVLSGTYEDLWKFHLSRPEAENVYQGQLPQFSMRMSAVTAAILLPQIDFIDIFSTHYRHLYKLLSGVLRISPKIKLPIINNRAKLVCNSVQFAIPSLADDKTEKFMELLHNSGIPMNKLGLNDRNERCFWNWHYLAKDMREYVPVSYTLLQKTFDMKLRRRMTESDIVRIGGVILDALSTVSE